MTAAVKSADLEENFLAPQENSKSIPFIPVWLDDYGLSAIEFRIYCHIVRRAGKGGKCWESVPRIAKACRLGRNVTLKALHTLTEIYQLLVRNKRPGETDEYSLAPQSQWQEPVPLENRLPSRRRQKMQAHPSLPRTGDNASTEQQSVDNKDVNVIQLQDYQEEPLKPSVSLAQFSSHLELSTQELELSETQINGVDDLLGGFRAETEKFSFTKQSNFAFFPPAPEASTLYVNGSFNPQIPQLQNTNSTPCEDISQKQWEEQSPKKSISVSIWRNNPDATRYCQIPPIYNQAVGVEIQNQIETEGLTAQAVVERAIAFSKVPKLILETLFAINQKLLDGHKWLVQVLSQQQQAEGQRSKEAHGKELYQVSPVLPISSVYSSDSAITDEVEAETDITEVENTGIPQNEWKYLKDIDIHLSYEIASELWEKYSHKFTKAISYVDKQEKKGKVHNRAAYFRACLEQGWIKDSAEKRPSRDPYELTQEQMQWYEWACSVGLCDGRPIRYYGLMGAELGIVVFEPEFQSNAIMPLSRAMQKYPKI
jgi:hypothetical protein